MPVLSLDTGPGNFAMFRLRNIDKTVVPTDSSFKEK